MWRKCSLQRRKAADHIILVHRMYAVACLNPETGDGFSSGIFDRIISAVHAQGKTVIVISCALPYDAARFPDADAVLLTYWGSAMPELPAEGGAWSANLPAGLLACFSLCSTEGKLPVDIPALDEQYLPMGGILFSPKPVRLLTEEDQTAEKSVRRLLIRPVNPKGFSGCCFTAPMSECFRSNSRKHKIPIDIVGE